MEQQNGNGKESDKMEIDVDEMYKKAREIGVDIYEIMDNRKQRIVPDDKIAKIKYWLKGNIKYKYEEETENGDILRIIGDKTGFLPEYKVYWNDELVYHLDYEECGRDRIKRFKMCNWVEVVEELAQEIREEPYEIGEDCDVIDDDDMEERIDKIIEKYGD